ncbi:hypothetical protein SO802_013012 [Lithocarpus litseifolius]|uniref:Uncharacterized protein n=1 Tax=Lithocarpus litseifolius TaxID=425828 RepID=A0AAW2D9W2_9ROSI
MTDLLILAFILQVKERYPCKYPQDKGQVKRKLKHIKSGRSREAKNIGTKGTEEQIRKEEEEEEGEEEEEDDDDDDDDEEEQRMKNRGPDRAGRRRLRFERKTQIGWKKKRTKEEEEQMKTKS